MGKLLVLKDSSDGGVEIKRCLGAQEKERLLVPRNQPTNLTSDGCSVTLKLRRGDVFAISDGCSVTLKLRRGDVFAISNGEVRLYFIWNGLHKTTLESVASLYRHHSVPMPFSVGGGLVGREWMVV